MTLNSPPTKASPHPSAGTDLAPDQHVLWREYKAPYHYLPSPPDENAKAKPHSVLNDPQLQVFAATQSNSLCGEATTIYMALPRNFTQHHRPILYFTQKQCSIALAAGSLLCQWVSCLPLKTLFATSIEQLLNTTNQQPPDLFHLKVLPSSATPPPSLLRERLADHHTFLSSAHRFPTRARCYRINPLALQNCLEQAHDVLMGQDQAQRRKSQ